MTKSRAQKMVPFILAYAEGKTIQIRVSPCESWMDLTNPNFDNYDAEYRIKPEPKYRPWKPEEVPVGAIVKLTGENRWLITACHNKRVFLNGSAGVYDEGHLLVNLLNWNYLVSLDSGKTWQPCGVLES